MGAVWRAWDRRTQTYVAAKVLQQRDSASLLRFIREQAVRIEDPHVVKPLGWAGEDDRVLFTMPLVRGGSVATLRGDSGPLPQPWVGELMSQLLAALAAVHHAGVVHRDVKPGNLLLDPTGTARPFLRLSDFGIALPLAGPRLTRTDVVIAPSGYLSPEVAQGADPTPTQDLYAAGRVGITMITGVDAGRVDWAVGVDPALVALIERLTEADPRNRPADGSAALALAESLGLPAWVEETTGWRSSSTSRPCLPPRSVPRRPEPSGRGQQRHPRRPQGWACQPSPRQPRRHGRPSNRPLSYQPGRLALSASWSGRRCWSAPSVWSSSWSGDPGQHRRRCPPRRPPPRHQARRLRSRRPARHWLTRHCRSPRRPAVTTQATSAPSPTSACGRAPRRRADHLRAPSRRDLPLGRGRSTIARSTIARSTIAQRGQLGLAAVLEGAQLGQCLLQVAAALFEVGSTLVDLAQHVLELAGLAARGVVELDDGANLLQRKAKPLAAHDETQPGAVPAVVDPLGAPPLAGRSGPALRSGAPSGG